MSEENKPSTNGKYHIEFTDNSKDRDVKNPPEIGRIGEVVKDGQYFLHMATGERRRLLALATIGDSYIDLLFSGIGVSDDIFKQVCRFTANVRHFVASKLQKFERLCRRNMDSSQENQFPIATNDLQRHWDMLCSVQVQQLDADFAEIEQIKANNWERPLESLEDESETVKANPTDTGAQRKPLLEKTQQLQDSLTK